MEIAGYIAALLIGISLGMIGGGGSILTVPVLVYLMQVHPLLASSYSLFIVGSSSAVGGLSAYSRQQVDFKSITEFGFPSVLAVFIARHFVLPVIPQHLFYLGETDISRDRLLMLLFALLMLISAVLITRRQKTEKAETAAGKVNHHPLQLILSGMLVGFITGLLGAGGGFLIIPILLLYVQLPMKTAVGTSLMIIAINSIFGFLFTLKQLPADWTLLISFSIISIAGILIGSHFSAKVPGRVLRKLFAWFIFLMAFYILCRELIFPFR